jgi:acetyl/propionyl-CoA carboxylase alpha subunit
VTPSSHIAPKSSTNELKLFALMQRDCDVLRARAIEDEAPAPGRSPETRAKIAAAMRGNSNRKIKSQSATSPGHNPGRMSYG